MSIDWVSRIDALMDKQKKEETPLVLEDIPSITLAEFAKRDLGIEIYSEVLGCNIWLCSNDKMAAQIKKDAPWAACYTVDELRHLLSLDPRPESLKKIHGAKTEFPGSKIRGNNEI